MAVVTLVTTPYSLQMFFVGSLADKFTNLFLFGMNWRISFADYPDTHWNAALFGMRQAWTLGAELTFYLVAPFLLRTPRLCLLVFLGSVVVRAVCVAVYGFDEHWTYYFLPSTFLFFLLGHFGRLASEQVSFVNSPIFGTAMLIAMIIGLLKEHVAWDTRQFWM